MVRARLSFGSKEAYDPKALKNYSEKELRREYTRLRDIAEKRLKRFEGTEWVTSDVYKMNKGRYPKLSEIQNKAQLTKKLSDLARYVDASTSSVSGLKQQRRRAIQSLHDQGYTFINTKNFKAFTEFMDEMRSGGKRFGSPTPEELETYMIGREKQISEEALNEDFEFWMQNRKKLARIDPPKNRKKASAAYYRKKIRSM